MIETTVTTYEYDDALPARMKTVTTVKTLTEASAVTHAADHDDVEPRQTTPSSSDHQNAGASRSASSAPATFKTGRMVRIKDTPTMRQSQYQQWIGCVGQIQDSPGLGRYVRVQVTDQEPALLYMPEELELVTQ